MKLYYDVRNQHLYVPGKTRHGKSTLFLNMAIQDIEQGAGICVIDPKGDLVNRIIHYVPEKRKDDCIYISTHNPVPINFLDYKDDTEKETLVGELKYVITRGMSAESAPLMDAIITDLLYTLLDARESMPKFDITFLDVHRFLSAEKRREHIMQFVRDPELRARWDTMPNPKECAPTLTRMTPFVRNPSLRRLFDCPEPTLNIAELMDNRRILLVNLGGVSESTRIFATLLIAKIRQAAFRRGTPGPSFVPESQRIPFFLYVDEFEFFQTQDFDQILSFAAGYGLRLTLANQFIGQLDSNIRQSIFGNVGSFIVFCVSPDDARFFRHIAGEHDLANIEKYEALYKIAGQRPVLKSTPAPPEPSPVSHAEYIRKRTIDLYSCKTESRMTNTSTHGKPEKPDPPRSERTPESPQGVPLPHAKSYGFAPRPKTPCGTGKPEPPTSSRKS